MRSCIPRASCTNRHHHSFQVFIKPLRGPDHCLHHHVGQQMAQTSPQPLISTAAAASATQKNHPHMSTPRPVCAISKAVTYLPATSVVRRPMGGVNSLVREIHCGRCPTHHRGSRFGPFPTLHHTQPVIRGRAREIVPWMSDFRGIVPM
ncbi:unnamed protein product [Meganyctiphanes norvegica]|uniref:Uncharacterized protein n=1 Tax=Meganyctiphanes norvegica TaxID=48144 RepID=A0AAV2SFN0_MEGNR